MRYWRIGYTEKEMDSPRLFDEGYPWIYGGALCGFQDEENSLQVPTKSRKCADGFLRIEEGDIIVVGGSVWCYYLGRAITKSMYVFRKYGPHLPDTPFIEADEDTKNKFMKHKIDPEINGRFHDVACVKTVWGQEYPGGIMRIEGIADGHGQMPGACTEITNPVAIRTINSLLDLPENNQTERKGDMKENLTTELANTLKQVKNLILTGAPGTGKTYMARQIALQMIFGENTPTDENNFTDEEKKQFKEQFEFVQFHPSYDYTDFVEGLRPVNGESGNEIGFELKDGIFKAFCERAKTSFEQSDCVDNFDEAWGKFCDEYPNGIEKDGKKVLVTPEGDISMTISIINKDNCYKRYRGLSHKTNNSFEGAFIDEILKGRFELKDYSKLDKNYIFVIDEINRGEISKIFGELFFSIDPGYRGEKGAVETQYSNMHEKGGEKFYVPENVYIIGTMNDIDRSVESFDFAMRRRFTWREITAEQSAENMGLSDDKKNRMKWLNDEISKIDGLNLSYHIGGAYFIGVNLEDRAERENLWNMRLRPLLFEYLRGMPDAEAKLENVKKAYDGNSDKENNTENQNRPAGNNIDTDNGQ